MPKRARESEGGGGAEDHGTKKRQREDGGEGGAGASKLGARRQLQAMRLPCTLPRLKEGQELVLLRYPASLDLSLLAGCTVPAALLGGSLGGGHTLQLRGGQARLAAAPRSVASQGMYVAVVGAVEGEAGADAEAGGAQAGGASGEAPPPPVHLLPAPAALMLDLALVPQTSALAGLRTITLTRRTPVPRAVPSARR